MLQKLDIFNYLCYTGNIKLVGEHKLMGKNKKITKNQHCMPQFLQKKFIRTKEFTELNQKKVKIYKKLTKGKEPPITICSIKASMVYDYLYGKSDQSIEQNLSKIESNATKIINEILEDPDKFQRNNTLLPQSLMPFIVSMEKRSPKNIKIETHLENALMAIGEQFVQSGKIPEINPEIPQTIMARRQEYQRYLKIDQNPKTKQRRFILLTSQNDNPVFLPDQIYPGFCPLSKNTLLIYDPCDPNDNSIFEIMHYIYYMYTGIKDPIIFNRIKSKLIKIFININNYIAIRTAHEHIILGEHTTINDINTLMVSHKDLNDHIPDNRADIIPTFKFTITN